MNEKKFGRNFVAQLKRTAQNAGPDITKKAKLEAQKAEIEREIEVLNAKIAAYDAPVRIETGYGVEELIVKRTFDTGKVDKDGKAIRKTVWELRYPETIVPIVEAPEDGTEILEGVMNENPVEE